jgi:hypothetical protein
LAAGGSRELNTKATVAGGGAGTLLVAVANQLAPGNETLASILIYAAPGVSVSAAAAWVLLAALAKHWRTRFITDRAVRRARKLLNEACSNPKLSDAHKAHMVEKVEHFEKLSMAVIQAEFDSVEAKIQP